MSLLCKPRHIVRDSFLYVVALVVLVPTASLGGEREMWQLWQKHMAGLDDHSTMVRACQKYTSAFPTDPLVPVVRCIEAWHLLSDEKGPEAVRILAPYLRGGNSGVAAAAQRQAREWVTRLQYTRLVDALQFYYRKEVRYPAKLDELATYPGLPGAEKLPLKDAWGKRWRYRLAGFKGLPGFLNQKYVLESTSTEPPFDPAEALTLPYAEKIQVRPSRVRQDASAVKLEFLEGENKGKTTVGQLGRTVDGLTVAYAGNGLVILCDALHWKVLTWKK